MRHAITINGTLALLLASLSVARGQGTILVKFDRYQMPPGTVRSNVSFYLDLESYVSAQGRFTLRWSGAPLFPDNGTAYLQPAGGEVFFVYQGTTRRFDAVSVDLALYSATSLEPVTVQFVASGYTLGRDIIATTAFTVSGAWDSSGRPTFQTFYFPPEFRNMYYLSVYPSAPLWSLDNLVIIPEPSAWALLAVGAGLFWVGHRRWVRAEGKNRGDVMLPRLVSREVGKRTGQGFLVGSSLLALLLVGVATAQAQGTIQVTFDPPVEAAWSYAHVEKGVFLRGDVRWPQPGDPILPYNGTLYVQPGGGSGEWVFSYYYAGNRKFGAVSVDLAVYSVSSLAPVMVQFIGFGDTRREQVVAATVFTVNRHFDAAGRLSFQTFHFPSEFRDLFFLSVSPAVPLWSLDNLVIVPEPSAWALLALGGGGLLAMGRLNRRQRAGAIVRAS